MKLWEIGVNYSGGIDDTAPYEIEVRYKGLNYIVRRGRIVEIIYGPRPPGGRFGVHRQRCEPTNLSEEDYRAILQLARDKVEREQQSDTGVS